jgi:hypothetical protein
MVYCAWSIDGGGGKYMRNLLISQQHLMAQDGKSGQSVVKNCLCYTD